MSYTFSEQFAKTYKAKQGLKDKIWHEGYYVLHNTRQVCPLGDKLKGDDFEHFIFQDSFANWNMPRFLQPTKIDVNTLCKHTGFFDQNNSYFENDYVKFLFREETDSHIGIIRFGEYMNPLGKFGYDKHYGFYIDWVCGENKDSLRKDFVGLLKDGLIEHTKNNAIDNPNYIKEL